MQEARCSECGQGLRDSSLFCSACGTAQRTASPSLALALDASTLAHLAVGSRGLLRLRVENLGAQSIPGPISLRTTLSDDALPLAETSAELAAGAAIVLSISVSPTMAGYHAFAGELVAGARYQLAKVYLRVGGDGPQVSIVNIDQSSARVIDNSRSTFGVQGSGGMLGADADWRELEVAVIPEPAPPSARPRVLPRADFTITTELAAYRAHETIAHGDIATVYGGRTSDHTDVVLKIADQAADNDLLQHEARVLGLLLAKPDKTSLHFTPPRDQFRTGDGRMGTVFPRLDGLDLTALRDSFRDRGESGLPPRHVVWILRRALAALGWAHSQGILHGNVDPSHVLVRGQDHMVWLVDWCWAVVKPAQTGQTFKALNEVFSPPEVAARGKPSPASDIYALGKCAIHVLGGDPSDKTMPDAVDAKLARFIRYLCLESQGGRGQDAWELYMQLDKIREQIWGPHQFVPLDLSHSHSERN
ncbi:MAG: inactive serine/threonine-protein kinase VRK3 [Myxococcota bacterium]|nr:inactive serine/threonine-protein kinase VRK3 [Myxococcota bacterium]